MNIDIGLTGEDTVKGTLHNRPGFAEQLFYSKKKGYQNNSQDILIQRDEFMKKVSHNCSFFRATRSQWMEKITFWNRTSAI